MSQTLLPSRILEPIKTGIERPVKEDSQHYDIGKTSWKDLLGLPWLSSNKKSWRIKIRNLELDAEIAWYWAMSKFQQSLRRHHLPVQEMFANHRREII